MFGLFGKKNKKEQVTHTSAPHDANQGSHSGQATTSDGGATPPQTGVLRYQQRGEGPGVLTTGYGEQVYAFITPVAPFVTSNQYVREFLPGVYRMLATLDTEHFNPLTDAHLPRDVDMDSSPLGGDYFPGVQLPGGQHTIWEIAYAATESKAFEQCQLQHSADKVFYRVEFALPFAAALVTNFPRFLQKTGIPDHGHGHVVSVPGGRVVLVYPVRPNQPVDELMKQVAMVNYELPKHPVNITPQTFWVRGSDWKSLNAEDGTSLFVPESYPALRDAQGGVKGQKVCPESLIFML
ncbi:hypothetical protein [Corynebacterium resistens]|nr:hypothetical protein [Corynebacterium resistens]